MPNSPEKPNQEINLTLSIEIISYYGKPAIQLKKIIKDKEVIKQICDNALKEKPMPAKIEFKDKFYAASRLKAAKLI